MIDVYLPRWAIAGGVVLMNIAPHYLLNRSPLELAKKAVRKAVTACRRPRPVGCVSESAQVDSERADSEWGDPEVDSEAIERLEFQFPLQQALGSYERTILRGGLPAHVPGSCNVCGHGGGFRLRSDNFREDLVCPGCKASNRKRQVVAVLMSEAGFDWQATLAQHADRLPRTIWVMESGPFAEVFGVRGVISSEFLSEGHASGGSFGPVRHEDVMHPSFEDDSLDVVVSCDVLEHVADAYLAHAEVFRCLKPGGFHVFTVPFHEHRARDEVLATVEDGAHRYHKPKIYHGDPRRRGGILVYRIFSIEMLTRLEQLGYEVKLARIHSVRFAMLGPNGIVFVARKPGPN